MTYQNGNTLPRQPRSKMTSPIPDMLQSSGFESPWLKRGGGLDSGTAGDPPSSRNLENQQSVNAAYSAMASPAARGIFAEGTTSAVLAASRPHYATLGRSSRSTAGGGGGASGVGARYRSSSATCLTQTDLYGDDYETEVGGYGGNSGNSGYGCLTSPAHPRYNRQLSQPRQTPQPRRDLNDPEASLLRRYATRERTDVTATLDRTSRARSADRADYDYDSTSAVPPGGNATVNAAARFGGLSRRETMPSHAASPYASAPRQPRGRYDAAGVAGTALQDEDAMARAMLSVRAPQHLHSKDMLILDLQTRIAQLNSDCATLNSDLESTREKLDSNMNSIRTFWSPELKKERAIRKEEAARHTVYRDQQMSQQTQLIAKHQTELRLQKEDLADLEALTFAPTSDGLRRSTSSGSSGASVHISEKKESSLLRKTILEMEMRITSQKETLANRDESIKRLLGIMRSKGSPYNSEQLDRIDLELSRSEIAENQRQIKHLQTALESKDAEMLTLRKTAEDSSLLIQHQEKLGKSESQLVTAEAQIVLLKTQIENYERQCSDDKHRISLVREQLTAKENQVTLQLSELEKYKLKLQDKDQILSKKSARIQESENSLKRIEHEMDELQDNSHQVEMLMNKDQELVTLRHRIVDNETKLKNLSDTESLNNENNRDIKRSLSEKEKIIKRLQEDILNSETSSRDAIKELEKNFYESQKSEHKLQLILDLSQTNVSSLTTDLHELKIFSDSEHKKSIKFELGLDLNKKELEKIKISNEQLKSQLSERTSLYTDKSSEMSMLQDRISNYVQDAKQHTLIENRLNAQIIIIEKNKIQEIQKLTKQLEDLESEDHRRKVKHDADMKQDSEDTVQLKRVVTQYTNRVEELEEALKKSVTITTQREMHMQGLQSTIDQQHKQTTCAHEELHSIKDERDRREEQFAAMESILKERDEKVLSMQVERRMQLKELYEMKQEAVVAAISEKDAHIALLENTPNSNQKNIDNVAKLTSHKLQLQKQLSDLTQKRMNIHMLEDELEEKSRIPVLAKKSPRKNKKSSKV